MNIEGVEVIPLTLHADERGYLLEILRADSPHSKGIGQCYVTTSYDGVVKGWHLHRLQYDQVACVHGMLKVVLYDNRIDSPTAGGIDEIYTGVLDPKLIVIPPNVYHGWKAYDGLAIVVNCPSNAYNDEEPDEYKLDPHCSMIAYDWGRVDK